MAVPLAQWSLREASVFCFLNAALYVGSLYLIPRNIRSLPRDDVRHMKYRMTAVLIATVLSTMTFTVVVPISTAYNASILAVLGFAVDRVWSKLVATALLMSLFYLGPLMTLCHLLFLSLRYEVNAKGLLSDRQPDKASAPTIITDILLSDARELYEGPSVDRWIALRNLVVAPVTEEIVFRSVLAPAFHMALVRDGRTHNTSAAWTTVWVTPLWFGVAHMHHLIEKMRAGWPLGRAAITTLVQLTYTTIFGVIATLLFLRTGCVYTALLSHVICNFVGLPNVSFLQPPGRAESGLYSCMYDYRYVHLVMHALGLVLFSVAILPVTQEFTESSIFWS